MRGNFIDTFRSVLKRKDHLSNPATKLIDTDFGRVRVLDTMGNKPVIINVPDGPNVIEHHEVLIQKLSGNYRVICFEFPGFGHSLPTSRYDYSLKDSAGLIINLMDALQVTRAALVFSCANGFYAIKAVELAPERFSYLFLAQTPSMKSMSRWVDRTIPLIIRVPVIGQITNACLEKKFARSWYKYALPKTRDIVPYQEKAIRSLEQGGCFCLSALVQGLSKDMYSMLKSLDVPATLVWGSKDFTHKETSSKTILEHLPNCEIIQFPNCGHFPELENTNEFVSLIVERLNSLRNR